MKVIQIWNRFLFHKPRVEISIDDYENGSIDEPHPLFWVHCRIAIECMISEWILCEVRSKCGLRTRRSMPWRWAVVEKSSVFVNRVWSAVNLRYLLCKTDSLPRWFSRPLRRSALWSLLQLSSPWITNTVDNGTIKRSCDPLSAGSLNMEL